MRMKVFNFVVLGAVAALWVASSTQREKPVISEVHANAVRSLEQSVSDNPDDADAVSKLAQGYLDAHSPGLAINTIVNAPVRVRNQPAVMHLYARAILEEGRSQDALVMEKRVLDRCAEAAAENRPCSSYLIASATRRVDILTELQKLGVEDAQAHPEQSEIAYHNATRDVGLAVR
jgi:cytoskeletal protein RodZ